MRALIVIGFIFLCRLATAQNHLTDSLKTALKSSNEDTIKVVLLNELSFRILKYSPKQSLEFSKTALQLAEHLKFQRGLGEAKNNLATYYLIRGEADVALKLAFEADRIGEINNLAELRGNSCALLGTIYSNRKDYSKAHYYLAQAQKFNLKLKNILIASRIFNTLGLISLNQKKYDSATYYFKTALKIMQDGDEDYRVPEVINNLGLIYTRQGKDALAMEYYYQALESAKKSNNRRAQALALFNIGNHILSDKKYDDAEKILKQSLALTMATDEMKIRGSNYMALGQLKNETGKFDEAHVYILNFYELKDSLENIERVKKMDELEIRYETEKKEHTIELLEKDKKIQMLWANTLTIFLVMGAMLSIVIFYFQKNRERKNQMVFNLKIDQLTTQNNELSEKYKDVLASGNVKTIVSVDQRLLKKAIDVVEHNLGNPLFGVEQMANELAMSRTNLHRRIKAITGFSPSDLIRNIRLRKAATLLLNKADSIAQISFDVGFEDHSYFSKSFKKQFGVSPSEYLQSKEQPN
jgi:AraC-like DNA-binding protein/Tfp pilus assembly protein PilF